MAETLFLKEFNSDDTANLDLGVVATGSSDDKLFRVYNDSDLYVATGVVVSTVETTLYLSLDGVVFAAEVEIDTIDPNSASREVTLRRVTPRAALAGLYAAELILTPTAWTPALT